MNSRELRKSFLTKAEEIVCIAHEGLTSSKPENALTKQQLNMLSMVWPTINTVITQADDPIPVVWQGKDTQAKVDEVLNRVATGDLTPKDGKELIALISMGMEPVELAELAAKVAEIENR